MPLAIDAFETVASRPTDWDADGGKKSQTREVMVTGYTTPEEAAFHAFVSGEMPSFISYNPLTLDPPMRLKKVSAKETDSIEIWLVTGSYESVNLDDSGAEIDWTFSGTTTGGTTTVTQGIRYAKYGTGPDFNGAINVDKDGPQGVEIVIPKLEFQIEKVFPKGTLWFQYVRDLLRLTGTVNGTAWKDFGQRELLFLGADFSQKGGGDTSFSYKFACSPNRLTANGNALTIGSISGIEKFGHDFLWVDYAASEASGFVIRNPRTVHVHAVYEDSDFNLLRI